MSDKQTAAMLDKKLDEKTAHTMFVCGLVMVIAVLIHDGDHIRQALNWGYHIPLAIWALNLTVYIFAACPPPLSGRSAVSSHPRPFWVCTSSARPPVYGACGTSPISR